jgi:RHH-type rel operon transcriptional repressor/antitoxin RelB
MLAIRLPQSIEKRLERLARRIGRTKTFYAREAILEHLEDLEDLYLAERALEHIRGLAQSEALRFHLPRGVLPLSCRSPHAISHLASCSLSLRVSIVA